MFKNINVGVVVFISTTLEIRAAIRRSQLDGLGKIAINFFVGGICGHVDLCSMQHNKMSRTNYN